MEKPRNARRAGCRVGQARRGPRPHVESENDVGSWANMDESWCWFVCESSTFYLRVSWEEGKRGGVMPV
jgi:hypothetical protein